MIDYLQTLRDRPVWRETPEHVRERFRHALPRGPRPFGDVLKEFEAYVRPYVTGNGHPLFMGWVHGAGTPVGMIADMLAAGLNPNCGGRNHIGIDVERQAALWVAEILGFPRQSSGLFVTGSSMANLIGVLVARSSALGSEVRTTGLQGLKQRLVAYASSETHHCIVRAIEIAGLGSDNLRVIPVDSSRRTLRTDILVDRIEEDRAAGHVPFLVVGTAGTVNSGAIDPLDEIAEIASAKGLWFHVDGAIGAAAMLSPALRPLMKGLERADSAALDFHKWMHVPYDAGFVSVRDASLHLDTFASEAAYLSRAKVGLAGGDVWPCDLGPDLSRGFRALKVWFAFQTYGADRIGKCAEKNCLAATYLAERLAEDGSFELRAPVVLNIVCFGIKGERSGRANRTLVERLHLSGRAAPSVTYLDAQPVIRAAIVNHRTTREDIDEFVRAIGELVSSEGPLPVEAIASS
ncbi:pyridoxal-dependent decarboxylase [Bradyrhizobium ontarionense]|uniref:Pyridoxal-dependent decarboxylase n=1 Tax=Bradyrhizobium ontarionense TaxID=2898149 RepID=A0ABY3RM25_9BRAD|nr:pyridoxal-dependent decarboxylase [Bradyrhizobium sp. A19]UFZ08555.1 pyridoxal-dependent decarboxylase [Bradyrhizobium sp. A19]